MSREKDHQKNDIGELREWKIEAFSMRTLGYGSL